MDNLLQKFECIGCKKNIFERHRDFMKACHDAMPETPQINKKNVDLVTLYRNLIDEEHIELLAVLNTPFNKRKMNEAEYLEKLASEATDLLYVTLGFLDALGVKGEEIFEAIHSANMKKVGKDGKVVRNEQGKILKPENWKRADVLSIIKRQMSKE